jgi:Rod binding domain-containing protein
MQVGAIDGHERAGQAGTAPSPRLVRAAHEFEAQMMKELLKPMTGKDALTGEDDGTDGDGGASGALGEFASEALGEALSRQGGFGIANRIVKDLSHSGNESGTGRVTGELHWNNVMRAAK